GRRSAAFGRGPDPCHSLTHSIPASRQTLDIPQGRLKRGDMWWVLRQPRGGAQPPAAPLLGVSLRRIDTTRFGGPEAAGWARDVAPWLEPVRGPSGSPGPAPRDRDP